MEFSILINLTAIQWKHFVFILPGHHHLAQVNLKQNPRRTAKHKNTCILLLMCYKIFLFKYSFNGNRYVRNITFVYKYYKERGMWRFIKFHKHIYIRYMYSKDTSVDTLSILIMIYASF